MSKNVKIVSTETTESPKVVKVTPIGRLSYPHLFKPTKSFNGDKDQYSAQLIFDADTDLSALVETCKVKLTKYINDNGRSIVSLEQKNGKFVIKTDKDKMLLEFKLPFKDGNEKDKEEYKNRIYLQCYQEASKAIVICDRHKNALPEDQVYGGCYGRFLINPYCYGFNQKTKSPNPAVMGISFGLGGFQKTSEGEPFGSSASITDFDEVEDDTSEDPSKYGNNNSEFLK